MINNNEADLKDDLKIEFEHDNYFSHQVSQFAKEGFKGMLNSCLELEPKHLILQLNYFNDWEVGKRNLKTSDGRLFTQHEDL